MVRSIVCVALVVGCGSTSRTDTSHRPAAASASVTFAAELAQAVYRDGTLESLTENWPSGSKRRMKVADAWHYWNEQGMHQVAFMRDRAVVLLRCQVSTCRRLDDAIAIAVQVKAKLPSR